MLEVKNKHFVLDGKQINIYSGAIHYFRVLPAYWEDRLKKMKAAGLNTIETYCCWNLHEPKNGEFDFSGRLDIHKFIQTAKDLGLNVILRPGPYICAEWDFGGLPAWLLKDKNLRLRCNDEKYISYCKNYLYRLFDEIKDLFSSNGGNIIAVQVENEYGSYGNDKQYLNAIKKIYEDWGVKELLFTSDGDTSMMFMGGTVPGVMETMNMGTMPVQRFSALKKFQPDKPLMCTEFWCGWFDHWGELHHKRPVSSVMTVVNQFLDMDASFNFFMFHGGTNFGFTAGANYWAKYMPCVTSYDYYAPINEYGDYTPLYFEVRKALLKHQGLPETELPARPKIQNIGDVELTEVTSLFDNLDNIGEKHYSPVPENMEYYDQNFGMVYYKTILHGSYGLCKVKLVDPLDEAYLYIDGEYKGKQSILDNPIKKSINNSAGLTQYNFNKDETEISVLVDALGRTNYGHHLTDTKGLHGLNLGLQNLMNYEVITLPLDNIDKVDYSKNSNKYPLFFKGTFKTNSNAECFVELKNFKKGLVYVNGFNLGRYWSKGPQKTLYLPGCLLHVDKPNEIVILEMEKCKKPIVKIIDKHKLG